MTRRLLDRQSCLIDYLTSSAAIFDDADDQSVDPALLGIDRRLLGIEARFSFEKRMEKIVAVFPRTFGLLAADRKTLLREFVEACPPFDIGRLENASQFYNFLSDRRQREPRTPPYVRDVAACELAFATARLRSEDGGWPDGEASPTHGRSPQIRRSRDVVLLRSAHDIRPLFEDASVNGPPIARDVPLAIIASTSAGGPEIFELAPAIFDLLGSLDEWVDQATFEEWEDAAKLIADLATAQLVKIRR